jgi:hypothetical protein
MRAIILLAVVIAPLLVTAIVGACGAIPVRSCAQEGEFAIHPILGGGEAGIVGAGLRNRRSGNEQASAAAGKGEKESETTHGHILCREKPCV